MVFFQSGYTLLKRPSAPAPSLPSDRVQIVVRVEENTSVAGVNRITVVVILKLAIKGVRSDCL
jgi:hypothetical protein